MKSYWKTLALAMLLISLKPAFAELQNVEIDGSIRIRGNYFDYDDLAGEKIKGSAFVEQRTRLGVKADFTNDVGAYIELDNYNNWGEDFRSNYLTGSDYRGSGDIALHQGYIEARNLWGTPLNARIGRQELKLGSGWLVGANESAPYFTGLSFDALLLSYVTDPFTLHAVTAKLAENFQTRSDVDVYGLYSSYTGIENVALDAYWLYIRDDANFRRGLNAHVFGLRGAGNIGAFDFEAEAAYQYFNWNRKATGLPAGQTDADAFGANLLVGYTFDSAYAPRIQAGAAYFSGADSNDLAFNRLFSDWKYSIILDTDRNLSNHWVVHTGISANVTETLTLSAYLGYFAALKNREISRFLWWSKESRKPLGVEAGVKAQYDYSEDLSFIIGYSRLFALGGLRDGNFVPNNGASLAQIDDINYVYAETQLKF